MKKLRLYLLFIGILFVLPFTVNAETSGARSATSNNIFDYV